MNLAILDATLLDAFPAPDAETGRRAEEELVTVLAHDLQNLLTPLTLRLDLIRRDIQADRQPEEREVIAAQDAVRRLARMVSNVLSVNRLERGLFTLRRQPIDLALLVRETGRILATPTHPVAVRTPERFPVSADPAAIQQALENLIANAIRYSPMRIPVEVTAARDRRGGAVWAVLTVRDTGPGIPEALRSRMGERYVRGGKSPGLGLGLYLARQVAEAHGGTLDIETSGDTGTAISLGWPVNDDERSGTQGRAVS